MSALRFLLNGEPVAESGIAPATTVLNYLRDRRGLTGTKEGCAEGDCGACTVLVGEAVNGAMRFRAANSCLMILPQIDGRAIVTVEGLSDRDGPLHPVQQALVETDGTQCGFCTPGFVMAMAGISLAGGAADDAEIHDALAGNLCRCTGYRPIVDAVRRACARGTADPLADRAAGWAEALAALEPASSPQALAPRTLDDLLQARRTHPDATLVAGATDLGLGFAKFTAAPDTVISLGRVAELGTIQEDDRTVTFGAAVTYTDALPLLDLHFPSLAALVRRIGSRQIRALGTLGGNLGTASPIGDTLPCIVALGASVTLASTGGRRTLAVEDFITGYRRTVLASDEVIAAVHLPKLDAGVRFVAYKLSKRFDQDISTVLAAFRIRIADGRVATIRAAFGGMAATPARARAVEELLAARPWSADAPDGLDEAIARDFAPMSDQRGSADYRLRAAANLVRRLRIETSEDGRAAPRLEAL